VFDAVGVRVDEIPVTPEKIYDAMQKQAKGQDPRYGPTNVPVVDWPDSRKMKTPWQGGTGEEEPSTAEVGGS
jgi:hypothetical protein